MTDIKLRSAWKKDDPAFKQDAQSLWDTLGVFPRERDDRLAELVAIAYDADKVIGACTARIIEYKVLRARVFHLRPMIVPGPHHDEVLLHLLSAAKEALQPWAQAHPGERLKGILAIFDSDAYDGLYPEPILRRQGIELVLTGCTDEGRQIRTVWFDDVRLEK